MPVATALDSTPTNVRAFNFEGADLRVLERTGEPWWVLSEISSLLEVSNSRDAARRLDDDEKGVGIIDTPGGPQETTIINESGLYSLILTSRKPAAKRFKKWVTAEVLPAIRKTGVYSVATIRPGRKPSLVTTFRTGFSIAKMLGYDDEQAKFSAGQYCFDKCGENPLASLKFESTPNTSKEAEQSLSDVSKGLNLTVADILHRAKGSSIGNLAFHLIDNQNMEPRFRIGDIVAIRPGTGFLYDGDYVIDNNGHRLLVQAQSLFGSGKLLIKQLHSANRPYESDKLEFNKMCAGIVVYLGRIADKSLLFQE